MTIAGAPWWAKLLSILISQAGLMGAQYLAFLQHGGASVTIAIALLQAIQGSIAANGLGAWSAAGGALVKAGRAIQLGRGRGGPPAGGAAALAVLVSMLALAPGAAHAGPVIGVADLVARLLAGEIGPLVAAGGALLGVILVALGIHRRGRAAGQAAGSAQGRAAQAAEDRAAAHGASTVERAAADALEQRGQASAARAEASAPTGALTSAEADAWAAPPKGSS